jgi:hypothetical protein
MQSIYGLTQERYNFIGGLLSTTSNVVQQKPRSFCCRREDRTFEELRSSDQWQTSICGL